MSTADLIITNAHVFTNDPAQPTATVVAVRDGHILWVGTSSGVADFCGPATRVIDARGRTLLPGIHDAHFHLSMGALGLEDAQLDKVSGYDQLAEALHAHSRKLEHGWLVGRRLSYGVRVNGRRITREDLDAIVPDRPLALFSIDYHTVWANTEALRRSGLLHGAKIEGGAVVMGAGGLATGELHERAAFQRLFGERPPPSREDKLRLLRLALEQAAAFGITSVTNMDGSPEDLELYQELEARSELTLRMSLPFSVTPHTPLSAIEEVAIAMRHRDSPLVRTYGVKLFLDGVVDSGTALLLEPYADTPGHVGTSLYSQGHLERVVAEADRLGLQVAIHAIGDAAVRRSLDAYEHAAAVNGRRDARHRVEHIELIHPTDVHRFRELGVVASMQPLHASRPETGRYVGWLDKVGPGRWAHAFPWQTLRDAGAVIPFGTDWPVVTMDPFASLEAALGRQVWAESLPDQRQTLGDALASFTRDAAWAEHQEHVKGRIAAGLHADLVLLGENLEELSPTEIGQVRPALTMVDGNVVYEAAKL